MMSGAALDLNAILLRALNDIGDVLWVSR